MTSDTGRATESVPLTLPRKVRLFVHIWREALAMQLALRRHSLPAVVDMPLERDDVAALTPEQLSRAVGRSLKVGPWQPRCLVRSLVLYRLLRTQGTAPELVVGLPTQTATTDAHAWIEIERVVIGPPPGRMGHEELVRYPLAAPVGDRPPEA